jgi:hypothetical protein
MNYDRGYVDNFWDWPGRYANRCFDYFARHNSGRPILYEFNSQGYRGPEHSASPDISVFGSSFSFGVGIEYAECWHQQLGNYQVNCYAPAGFLVTNNDIIDHWNQTKETIKTGIVILQLREFVYNKSPIEIPNSVHCFVIDQYQHPDLFGFDYESFADHAEDATHPGAKTHKLWSQQIKTRFNL